MQWLLQRWILLATERNIINTELVTSETDQIPVAATVHDSTVGMMKEFLD